MEIKGYCHHKEAGWDGMIYVDDSGKSYVTDGFGIWEVTEQRQERLEKRERYEVDISQIGERLAQFYPCLEVGRLLTKAG